MLTGCGKDIIILAIDQGRASPQGVMVADQLFDHPRHNYRIEWRGWLKKLRQIPVLAPVPVYALVKAKAVEGRHLDGTGSNHVINHLF
jgi:hypothetical protein